MLCAPTNSPARQVDQMDFGDGLAWHVIHEDSLHKRNRKDGMTATARVIHVGAGRGAMGIAACNALLRQREGEREGQH